MKKYLSVLVVLMVSASMFTTTPQRARAEAGIGSYNLSCNSLTISGSANTPFVGLRLARGTDIDLPHPTNIIYDAFWFGTPTFGTSGGTYTITVAFRSEIPGTTLTFRVFGALTAHGSTWDGRGFATVTALCAPPLAAATTVIVPGVPTSPVTTVTSPSSGPEFVLQTVVCTTPVFDAPGGNPINSNQILAGQTWYVSRNIRTDLRGGGWVAVNIGTRVTVYIPASCVPGLSGLSFGATDGLGLGTGFENAPVYYVVKAGDTLGAIAFRFGVSVSALAQANGIRDINKIYVGQRLVIP